MPSIHYPLINGARPDFASIRISLVNTGAIAIPGNLIGFEAIDYQDETSAKFMHLTRSKPVILSRGKYRAHGSIDWFLEEHRVITRYLTSMQQGGFGDAIFNITISYSQTQTSPLITDELRRVRIVGNQQRGQHGGPALTTKTPLIIGEIAWGSGAVSGSNSFGSSQLTAHAPVVGPP